MKNNTVFVKEFEAPLINEKEVLRYFRAKEWTEETRKIFE